jgi:hypothetical protein
LAGAVSLNFSTTTSTRLIGTLYSNQSSFKMEITDQLGISSVECSFTWPVRCASPPDGSHVFSLQTPVESINLASLELNFTGANNILPPGSWTVFLVNWGRAPVEVTTDTGVVAVPDY